MRHGWHIPNPPRGLFGDAMIVAFSWGLLGCGVLALLSIAGFVR